MKKKTPEEQQKEDEAWCEEVDHMIKMALSRTLMMIRDESPDASMAEQVLETIRMSLLVGARKVLSDEPPTQAGMAASLIAHIEWINDLVPPLEPEHG